MIHQPHTEKKLTMKKIFLLLCIIQWTNCNAQSLKNNSWILGKWEMKMGNKSIFEEWKMQDDSTFVGSSYMQDGNGKQRIMETMELRSRGGVNYYVPTVKGQNNNKEVVFKISIAEENKFTAENSEHDFPQRIYYELISPNELKAQIEGLQKGKLRKEEWIFKK